MNAQLNARKEARLRLLGTLYKLCDGDDRYHCSRQEAYEASGLGDADVFETAFSYLEGHGLAETLTADSIQITHAGIVEYEQTLEHPSQATEHFSQQVVVNVHAPVGAIVTGNQNTANVQQQINNGFQAQEVTSLLRTLAAEIEQLDEHDRASAKGALLKVEAEVEKKAPDWMARAKLALGYLTLFPKLVATATTILGLITGTPG